MNKIEICEKYELDPSDILFLPSQFDECIAGVDYNNECIVYYSDKVISV